MRTIPIKQTQRIVVLTLQQSLAKPLAEFLGDSPALAVEKATKFGQLGEVSEQAIRKRSLLYLAATRARRSLLVCRIQTG